MTRCPWTRWPAVAAALIGIGLAGAAVTSGAASAGPAPDPHQFSDRTTEFVPLGNPGALAARDAG